MKRAFLSGFLVALTLLGARSFASDKSFAAIHDECTSSATANALAAVGTLQKERCSEEGHFTFEVTGVPEVRSRSGRLIPGRTETPETTTFAIKITKVIDVECKCDDFIVPPPTGLQVAITGLFGWILTSDLNPAPDPATTIASAMVDYTGPGSLTFDEAVLAGNETKNESSQSRTVMVMLAPGSHTATVRITTVALKPVGPAGAVDSAASVGFRVVPLGSLTYVATCIPEPETYAMLLAGLGLLGMVARRRRKGDIINGAPCVLGNVGARAWVRLPAP